MRKQLTRALLFGAVAVTMAHQVRAAGDAADQILVRFTDSTQARALIAYLQAEGPLLGIDEDFAAAIEGIHITGMRPANFRAQREVYINNARISMPRFDSYYVLTIADAAHTAALVERLSKVSSVASAEANAIEYGHNAGAAPEDHYWNHVVIDSSQWWMHGDPNDPNVYSVHAPTAWRMRENDAEVTVALIDEGVMLSHPDLSVRGDDYCIKTNCWDHGTRAAGILCGDHNTVGVAGMLDGADVVSYNVYRAQTVEAHIQQILDAADVDDADVICTSTWYGHDVMYPYYVYSQATRSAWQYAYLQGRACIAAAGNLYDNTLTYPANYGIAVCGIGSTDRYGSPSSYPYNTGAYLQFMGPAEGMITTRPPGTIATDIYAIWGWGTSLAMPVAAGSVGVLAAIAKQRMPASSFLAEDYYGILASTATDIIGSGATAGRDTVSGWGRIDLGRAALRFGGNFKIEFGAATGGTVVDSSSGVVSVRLYGFDDPEIADGEYYPVRWYRIAVDVDWAPGTGFIDSVFCWGRHAGTSGYRPPEPSYLHELPQVMAYPGGPMLFNINASEPDLATATASGCTYYTYGYRVYHQDYPDSSRVVTLLGPVDPSEATVAYGVVGRTGDVFRGEITTNVTIDGDRWIDGDIAIRSGATLTISAGAQLRIADYDLGNLGEYDNAVEIIVEGAIVVQGQDGAEVELISGAAVPEMGSWRGVVIADSTASMDAGYLVIKHAECGIQSEGGSFSLAETLVDSCGLGIYAIGGTGEIENSEIANCSDRGVYARAESGGSADINVTGVVSHDNLYGFYFGQGTNNCTLRGGSVANDNVLTGIYCRSRMDIGPRVTASDNGQHGLVITKVGFGYAGTVDSLVSMGNSNGYGVVADSSAFPIIKNSSITDNYTNVWVANYSLPILGDVTAGLGMNNIIDNAVRYDVANRVTGHTVMAENCYWGPEVGGVPSFAVLGSVDLIPWLSALPILYWRDSGIVQRGATARIDVTPNPFNPSVTISWRAQVDKQPYEVAIYDLRGRRLRTLAGKVGADRRGCVTWDGRDEFGRSLASGVYFCCVESRDMAVGVVRMTLLR